MARPNRKWLEEVDSHRPEFMQEHFTAQEIANWWHMSVAKVKQEFADEPDLIRWGEERIRKGRKRVHVQIRYPAWVVRKHYLRLVRGGANVSPSAIALGEDNNSGRE